MKTFLLSLVACTFCLGICQAQDDSNNALRSIKIDDDGKDPVVKITTIEGGKKVNTTLKGEKAREYIDEHAKKEASTSSSYTFSVSTQSSDELLEDLAHVTAEVSRELKLAAVELQKLEVDSVLNSVEANVQKTLSSVNSSTVSSKKPAKTVTIEDLPGGDSNLDFPVKLSYRSSNSSNTVTVQIENAGSEKVDIEVLNEVGDIYHKSMIMGDGRLITRIDINPFPTGDYTLEVRQGDRLMTKKLVIH